MINYIAIIEDAGPDRAVGVWFPDVPGCFSAGDTLDEAMANAREALTAHLDLLRADGEPIPRARTLSEMKTDPDVADDLARYMVAVIPAATNRTPLAAE